MCTESFQFDMSSEDFVSDAETATSHKNRGMCSFASICWLTLLVSHHAFAQNDPYEIDLGQLNSPQPGDILKALLSKSELPFPGKPIPASTLKKFAKVKSDSINPSATSSGFLVESWREDFSCSPDKKTLNVFGYRTGKCFVIDYIDDDSLGYGSYSYSCDESKCLSIS
jgi:hypothetical protein